MRFFISGVGSCDVEDVLAGGKLAISKQRLRYVCWAGQMSSIASGPKSNIFDARL